MSFEGFYECICIKGHYSAFDVYTADVDEPCGKCSQPIEWWRIVDETNGFELDNPDTFQAHTIVISTEDTWHEDHYGNKYATKRDLVRPHDESLWHKKYV